MGTKIPDWALFSPAALQSWLQGWPNKRRPGLAVRAGNGLSSARFHVAGWGILAALGLLYGLLWKGPKR